MELFYLIPPSKSDVFEQVITIFPEAKHENLMEQFMEEGTFPEHVLYANLSHMQKIVLNGIQQDKLPSLVNPFANIPIKKISEGVRKKRTNLRSGQDEASSTSTRMFIIFLAIGVGLMIYFFSQT